MLLEGSVQSYASSIGLAALETQLSLETIAAERARIREQIVRYQQRLRTLERTNGLLSSFAEPVRKTPANPVLRPFQDYKHAMLVESLVYRIGTTGDSVIVPHGFVTDYASIPRFAWSFGLIPQGPYATAAIIHDYLYWNGACSREEADKIFLVAMVETEVGSRQRSLIYTAVSSAGGRAYRENANGRARRLIRILEPPQRNLPVLGGWPSYQRELMQQGLLQRVPVPEISEKFCAEGLRDVDDLLEPVDVTPTSLPDSAQPPRDTLKGPQR